MLHKNSKLLFFFLLFMYRSRWNGFTEDSSNFVNARDAVERRSFICMISIEIFSLFSFLPESFHFMVSSSRSRFEQRRTIFSRCVISGERKIYLKEAEIISRALTLMWMSTFECCRMRFYYQWNFKRRENAVNISGLQSSVWVIKTLPKVVEPFPLPTRAFETQFDITFPTQFRFKSVFIDGQKKLSTGDLLLSEFTSCELA